MGVPAADAATPDGGLPARVGDRRAGRDGGDPGSTARRPPPVAAAAPILALRPRDRRESGPRWAHPSPTQSTTPRTDRCGSSVGDCPTCGPSCAGVCSAAWAGPCCAASSSGCEPGSPLSPPAPSPPGPWSLVVADTAAHLAHHRDDTITSRHRALAAGGPTDARAPAHFVWGLLQEAVVTNPPTPPRVSRGQSSPSYSESIGGSGPRPAPRSGLSIRNAARTGSLPSRSTSRIRASSRGIPGPEPRVSHPSDRGRPVLGVQVRDDGGHRLVLEEVRGGDLVRVRLVGPGAAGRSRTPRPGRVAGTGPPGTRWPHPAGHREGRRS